MFCKNCGKELDDGATFCTACGAQLNKTETQSTFETTVNTFATKAKTTINSGVLKKYVTKKNVIILAAVIVVVCIIGTMFSSNNAVNIVKNGYFYVNENMTVGELFNVTFDDVKWESFVADDGQTYVNATAIMDGEEIVIQFEVDEEKETFALTACEYAGIPIPIYDLF